MINANPPKKPGFPPAQHVRDRFMHGSGTGRAEPTQLTAGHEGAFKKAEVRLRRRARPPASTSKGRLTPSGQRAFGLVAVAEGPSQARTLCPLHTDRGLAVQLLHVPQITSRRLKARKPHAGRAGIGGKQGVRRPVRLACAAPPSFLGLLDDSLTDFGTTQLVYFEIPGLLIWVT